VISFGPEIAAFFVFRGHGCWFFVKVHLFNADPLTDNGQRQNFTAVIIKLVNFLGGRKSTVYARDLSAPK